jgi:hypothetical protein
MNDAGNIDRATHLNSGFGTYGDKIEEKNIPSAGRMRWPALSWLLIGKE